MNNPNEQDKYCWGKTKCAVILSEKLNKKQHKVVATFLTNSFRDLRCLVYIPDKKVRTRIRNNYLKGRDLQIKELSITSKLDLDSVKRIQYLIRFQTRKYLTMDRLDKNFT